MADRITELEAELQKKDSELERLRAELAKVSELGTDAEEDSRATLFMLEDLIRSQDSLEQAKAQWEATFDAITDPLFIHDIEFRIVRANRAYQQMAEMKSEDFIGSPYYEVFPKMEGPFKMCRQAQELHDEEEEFSCPVTNRIFKVRFYPIKDTEGKYLYSVHILEDITEAKRALERIKEESEITSNLLMIAEATTHTTDVDKLMEKAVHCAKEIIGCDILLFYLWDSAENVFKPFHEIGLPHNHIPMFLTEPLKEEEVEEMFLSGNRVAGTSGGVNFLATRDVLLSVKPAVLNVDSALSLQARSPLDSAFPWLSDITVSTIGIISLKTARKTLGFLTGIFFKSVEMNERLRKIMDGISYQVSAALEQARLYRESMDRMMELSHKIETIQVMHEIDKHILSILDKQEIIETIVRMVARLIPCDRAGIGLVDRERGGIVYTAGFGVDALKKGTFIPFKDTSNTEVVETGRPQYIPDFGEIKDILPIEKMLRENGFRSHIRVPLMIKGEVAGILNIGAKRPSAFTPEDLSTLGKIAAQIGIALENARLVSDLEELFLGTVKSLSSAIDAKSKWTAGHSERVTSYALGIGQELGLSEKETKDLELAGLLHDVGKIGTYELILDKPGQLTEDEVAVMRQHPVKGAEIIAPIKQLKHVIPAIKYHHEFYDGTGYPDGLKGEAIPFHARILAVADSVDAMGADRPYRKGRPMEIILEELKRCAGTQFDPKVVEAFLSISGKP